MPTVRSYLAAGAMTTVALTTTVRAHDASSLAFAAITLGGGLLFTRREVLAQVLARGVAWSIILPSAFVAWVAMHYGGFRPPLASMLTPALSAAALVLAHPMLHAKEAKASFAPLALRSWFLAASAGAVGAGIAFAHLAVAFLSVRAATTGLELLALGATLVASGVGLARMRAWSLLSSALATLMAIAFVVFGRMYTISWPVLGALIPGAMLFTGIAFARLFVAPQPVTPSRLRIAGETRVALDEDESELNELAGLSASEAK